MSDKPISPLAPDSFPIMPSVYGVELGAVAAGLRYQNRLDLMLAKFVEGTVATGVFTQSSTLAAPVRWSKQVLADANGHVRALVVNAGNANALTGRRGYRTAETMARAAGDLVGCNPEQVLVASTGLVGEIQAPGPLRRGVSRLRGGLSSGLYREAAEAIRTTDTFPKGSSRIAAVGGGPVTICGIAKGTCMIEPNMATMLGFIFTSARLSKALLSALLKDAVDVSFNAITIDGDTSTNDCVFAFATGGVDMPEVSGIDDPVIADFRAKFREVCLDLAHQIVRDGVGARKFITVRVEGAKNNDQAKCIAKAVANSTLVKTSVSGADPNWGRIVAAAGKAKAKMDLDKVHLWIGDHLVAHKGCVHLRYDSALVKEYLDSERITITFDAGVGNGKATVWTCDLTTDYVNRTASMMKEFS